MTIAADPPTLAAASGRPAVRSGRDERSLVSYLLLPRPGDLGKAALFPTGFAVGLVAAGTHRRMPEVAALVAWLVLELLIYQARYQWNDIRGFAADRAHPESGTRGRLPARGVGGLSPVAASRLVAFGRLTAAVLIGLAFNDRQLLEVIVVLGVAVFVVAWVYETLKNHATDRGEQSIPSVSPGLVSIWTVIGAGYAIRGVGGLSIAVDLSHRPWLAGAAVATCWLAGIAFVTSRWAVEATGFVRFVDGSPRWHPPARAARDHLLALVRWLPAALTADEGRQIQDPSRWRLLARRTAFTAPWNLATVGASAAAAATGMLMVAPPRPYSALTLALVGAVAAAVVVARPSARRVSLPAGAVAVGLAAWALGAPASWRAVLPWLLVTGLYARSMSQCGADLGPPFHRLRATLRRNG